MVRPAVLFISPVIPSLTGNGLAMRAGITLEALAQDSSVSLLVIQLYASPQKGLPPALERLCDRVRILPLRTGRDRMSLRLWTWRHRHRFDRIHAFRLAAVPFALPFMGRSPRPPLHIDLDDIESVTHMRLAELCRLGGNPSGARLEEIEASRSVVAEEKAFQQADGLYVCSNIDKERIQSRTTTAVSVLPNAIRIPENVPVEPSGGCFRFLFLATLGYLPNEDAGMYLCREIIPEIRKLTGASVAFDIVGGGASARLRDAARDVGAVLAGPLDSVDGSYAASNAVLVPLRAGGGTRIKILEAFAHRRPVVSSQIGAEGLYVQHGRDILISDSPDAFARACVALMSDADLRGHLSRNAFDLVKRCYSLDAVRQSLASN